MIESSPEPCKVQGRKEGSLCHTEWDRQDGDTVLTVMAEGDVGIPGGTGHRFHHGGHQPKKKRFGFSKKKPISFEKS
jgi:hypothetical protein